MGSRRKPRRSPANARLVAATDVQEQVCPICESDDSCPYHKSGTCCCEVFTGIPWEDLGSYIDRGDRLMCSECDQPVPFPFTDAPGTGTVTDRDLRALGVFRRGDWFRRVEGRS